jgi:hypothetical protein
VAAPAPSPGDLNEEQLLILLRASAHADVREWAVGRLAAQNEPASRDLIQGLLGGAGTDAAPAVRTACLRALLKLRPNDPGLTALVPRLEADQDPAVRAAAREVGEWLRTSSPSISLTAPPGR